MAKVWVVTTQVRYPAENKSEMDVMSVERVCEDRASALMAVEKLKLDYAPDGQWDEELEQARAGARKMADVWVLDNGSDGDDGYGIPMHIKITECVVERREKKSAAAGK